MAKARINGTLAPVLKSREIDFDAERGLVTHVYYESAGDNLGGLANTLVNGSISFEWFRSPVKSHLRATTSGGSAAAGVPDIPRTTYQLLANESMNSVLESPLAQGVEFNFPGTMAKIQSAQSAYTSGDEAAGDDIVATMDNDGVRLLDLLLKGTTHYSVGQYVLRRQIAISNTYTGSIPNELRAERIVGIAEVLAFEQMPVSILQAILTIPSRSAPGYLWGWRELPTTATTGAYNTVFFSTEFWLDLWSTALYAT